MRAWHWPSIDTYITYHSNSNLNSSQKCPLLLLANCSTPMQNGWNRAFRTNAPCWMIHFAKAFVSRLTTTERGTDPAIKWKNANFQSDCACQQQMLWMRQQVYYAFSKLYLLKNLGATITYLKCDGSVPCWIQLLHFFIIFGNAGKNFWNKFSLKLWSSALQSM